MRFGPDQLRDKALLALEEAVVECRYGRPRRSIALRFALAYLWTSSRAAREPFDALWGALGQDESPWSYSVADSALLAIYRALGVQRDDRVPMALWQRREREVRGLAAEANRMCNRYRQVKTKENLSLIFDARLLPDRPEPATELYPKRLAPVVRKEDGERVLDVMSWGFPPPPKSRAPVTNVRNLASPFWRSALGRPDRRCLVPVTEFCEWEGEPGSKRERWFSLPASEVFAFAGIWRPADEIPCFAFLTCEPNPLVAPIHAKAMPVILQPEDYERWLDGAVEDACSLAQPFPSQLMAVA